ncbi:MAG: phytase [Saprospiraceae bacterium]|nr:phytase [Saprospiraceae bacterium]MBK8371187.1 phytase [Saprospiraceae bacterium]
MLAKIMVSALLCCSLFMSCTVQKISKFAIKPVITTERVATDSDDPAIWVHPTDPSKSLIIGTDKGGDTGEGGLYVFDLSGKIDRKKTVVLSRPNNVDIAYGLMVNGRKTDIAVAAERNTNSIRVFSLPEMKSLDGGGIPVFADSPQKSPMGVALFTHKSSDIYAIVGRKTGPVTGYLYQYKLTVDDNGQVSGSLVRKFGQFSGKKEIEAIVVDNELGYVYCSDEGVGVRKYYAHPDSSDIELALFATKGVRQDHEGLSIYKANEGTGYILLSDQQANAFQIFPRQGTVDNPHDHPLIKKIFTSTMESDGSDISNVSFNTTFNNGLFVAMSTDGTFQFYRWEDLAGNDLFLAPGGIKKN